MLLADSAVDGIVLPEEAGRGVLGGSGRHAVRLLDLRRVVGFLGKPQKAAVADVYGEFEIVCHNRSPGNRSAPHGDRRDNRDVVVAARLWKAQRLAQVRAVRATDQINLNQSPPRLGSCWRIHESGTWLIGGEQAVAIAGLDDCLRSLDGDASSVEAITGVTLRPSPNQEHRAIAACKHEVDRAAKQSQRAGVCSVRAIGGTWPLDLSNEDVAWNISEEIELLAHDYNDCAGSRAWAPRARKRQVGCPR